MTYMGNNQTQWYLQPQLIIDRTKYKGRGRPKKTDYILYRPEEHLVESPFEIKSIKEKNNGDYEIKYHVEFKLSGILSRGDGC